MSQEVAVFELKLVQVGDEVGVVLPRELLDNLGAREGDTLDVTETPNGLLLSAGPEVFERQMGIARRIMREKRHILRRLADS